MSWRSGCAAVRLAVAALVAAGGALASGSAGAPAGSSSRQAIEQVLEDYVGLYGGPTLERWRRLFHPSLAVFNPGPEGDIRARGLEEFFAAQKGIFATGRQIHERLENVRIEEGRRIARVSADFVFVDEGHERRGKLGLHLAEGNEGWQVVGILFSYDPP